MKKTWTRRNFIKVSAAGSTAILAGSAISGGTKSSKKSVEDPNATVTITPTYCEMCTFKCAGWVYKKDGKPWKIKGNDNDHHSNGRLCTKGSAGIGVYTDPDRLRQPLIRTESRGKQVFKEVSWDEALDYIARKMEQLKKKHGPECTALLSHGAGGSFFKKLLRAYGSNNIAAPSYGNCRGPREEAYVLTYGEGIGSPERTDMAHSKCLVLIGTHLGENSHSSQVRDFSRAIAESAEIITVDPRYSTAASKSSHWLPIKPGTDMALLLAWIHVIINEKIYNHSFVKKNTIGFEQLKTHVQQYTPEWAYTETTIDPAVIRKTARIMAKNAPHTLVHPGRFTTWYGDDTQRVRAGAILNALLGNWGQKGGFFNPVKVDLPSYPHPAYPKPRKNWRDAFPEKYKLANLALASGICEATIPSPERDCHIKSWIVYGTNLIKTFPNKKQTIEAIQKLELLVVVDILPTEITGWADVILPECSYLERYDELRVSQGKKAQIALRMPAFKPLHNSKPAWWIAKKLSDKLGLSQYLPWKNVEAYLDFRLKKIGSSLEEMKKKGVITVKNEDSIYFSKDEAIEFDTDSGKIELYSDTLASAGFDPMPKYTKHAQPDPDFYRLLSGRTPMHSFSRTTNNPLLTQLYPENEVWINSTVARQWDIKNGQRIKLKNQDNIISTPIRVKVTERIRQDAVYLVHGFGGEQKQLRRAYRKGASDSILSTNVLYDQVMGGTGFRGNFVTFVV